MASSESNASGQNSNGEDIIKPSELSIAWGNDSRYWRMPEKNSGGPAELLQVCWLEVTGTSKKNLDLGKKYEISFKISMKPEAFGWKDCTVFMMAKIGKRGKYTWKRIKNLDDIKTQPADIPKDKFVIEVPGSEDDKELHFGLYEVWSGKSKGGLEIHHACVKEAKQP